MRILVNRNGQQSGPYTLEQLREAVQTEQVSPTDLSWLEGTPTWVPVSALLLQYSGVPALPPNLPPPGAASPFNPAGAESAPLAVTSMVLGIVSYALCLNILTGIPAIICGHVARGQIARSAGALKGAGMALAGLIMGYASFLLVLPMAVAIFLPAFSSARSAELDRRMLSNARTVAVNCAVYANDHEGTYPPNLEALVPKYLNDASSFTDSRLKPPGPAFDYTAAGRTNPQAGEVVLIGRFVNKKGQHVVARVGGEAALEEAGLGSSGRRGPE